MANEKQETKAGINALGAKAAYNLANVTKTKPQYGALTPKWLTKFLEFKGLETGIFRVNKVQGNADNLSAWFDDNLEIAVTSQSSNASKAQARQIVKNFFESHTPRSFEVNHTAGRDNMKYALGTLNAGGESYSVTIFVSSKGKSYKIQQLKIEQQL